MVTVELIHIPEDRNHEVGECDWAQITYNTLRVGRNDGSEDEIAFFSNGYWYLNRDMTQVFTDVSICGAEAAS